MEKVITSPKDGEISNTDPANCQDLVRIFAELIKKIGEDPNREGLIDTPLRAAKAFQYLMQGYHLDAKTITNNALFTCDNHDMVIAKDIELFSTCEHHLLPIIGKCHIGYLPNGKVIGLSKIARIVDVYARRLQMQERLTQQIAEAIVEASGAFGAGVIIEADHLCMKARGVEKQHSFIKTCAFVGSFTENPIKTQFYNLIN